MNILALGATQQLSERGEDPATIWIAPRPSVAKRVDVTIDMVQHRVLVGYSLTPTRCALSNAGPPARHIAETSIDGTTWISDGAAAFGDFAHPRAPSPAVIPAHCDRRAGHGIR